MVIFHSYFDITRGLDGQNVETWWNTMFHLSFKKSISQDWSGLDVDGTVLYDDPLPTGRWKIPIGP